MIDEFNVILKVMCSLVEFQFKLIAAIRGHLSLDCHQPLHFKMEDIIEAARLGFIFESKTRFKLENKLMSRNYPNFKLNCNKLQRGN